MLTYVHIVATGTWAKSDLPAGQVLREPTPLFKKLDESVVGEESVRLEGQAEAGNQESRGRGAYR
jgi:hypothetical protein